MREIGSEFWSVPESEKTNNLFPESVQWFASGRSALKGILNELKWAKTIAVPSWCCDSIIKPITEAGKEIFFYPVLISDGLHQKIETDCDVLLLIDYFGFYSEEITKHRCIIIRDITHSVFSTERKDADYYFGSLRKWCGLWSGGFAWAKDEHQISTDGSTDKGYFNLRRAAMEKKAEYINNGGKIDDKAEFIQGFIKAECILDNNIGAAAGAERDILLINKLDIDTIRCKRRDNANILLQELQDISLFRQLNDSDCPLFVPIVPEKDMRDIIHSNLVDNSIYCPKHWPVSEYHRLDDQTKELYLREISLICDQRYSEADMRRIVQVIRKYI